MTKVLVTVIITTFNRPVDILKRAVSSVINQTYQNIEIFIVNDYPENKMLAEKIRDMLNSFEDNRLHYIILKNNSGACAARNTGIRNSNGEYFCFLDDDDAWLPEKIELQLNAFTNKKIGLVYSPFYNIDVNDKKLKIVSKSNNSGDLFECMLYEDIVGGSSMTMISKAAIEDVGMFDERLLSSQDYDLYLRIAQKYDCVCVDEPLIYRYVSEESITKNHEKQCQGWEMFTDKYQLIYENNLDAYSYRINCRVNVLLTEGYFKEAIQIYKRALSIKLFSKYNLIEPLKGIIKFFGYKIFKIQA